MKRFQPDAAKHSLMSGDNPKELVRADSPEQLSAPWQDAVARSRSVVSEMLADGGLDQLARRTRPDGQAPSLRRILIDLIEEYARHIGHADLIRESVDGPVGEDPLASRCRMRHRDGVDDAGRSREASDEELQESRIGELSPHNAAITLVDYDPAWPRLFADTANMIRSVLGETALRVEHVGSTSVPGLIAKPIIDILLVVPDSADEAAYRPTLEAAGFVLRIREPEWFEHRMFKGPDVDINLHVFTAGASEIERMLRFRDWLRAVEADRNHYAAAKRQLAQGRWRHVQHYADAKTAVVHEIMDRAEAAG